GWGKSESLGPLVGHIGAGEGPPLRVWLPCDGTAEIGGVDVVSCRILTRSRSRPLALLGRRHGPKRARRPRFSLEFDIARKLHGVAADRAQRLGKVVMDIAHAK